MQSEQVHPSAWRYEDPRTLLQQFLQAGGAVLLIAMAEEMVQLQETPELSELFGGLKAN